MSFRETSTICSQPLSPRGLQSHDLSTVISILRTGLPEAVICLLSQHRSGAAEIKEMDDASLRVEPRFSASSWESGTQTLSYLADMNLVLVPKLITAKKMENPLLGADGRLQCPQVAEVEASGDSRSRGSGCRTGSTFWTRIKPARLCRELLATLIRRLCSGAHRRCAAKPIQSNRSIKSHPPPRPATPATT